METFGGEARAAAAPVVVRCAGTVYRGRLESARSEWAGERTTVYVSIVVRCLDRVRRRFYFETSDAEAWARLELDGAVETIEATAMKELIGS